MDMPGRDDPRPAGIEGRRPGLAPSACRICCATAADGSVVCGTCRAIAAALGRPLLEVTAISLVTATSSLYRALRQYKSGEPDVARRQRDRLAALLQAFAVRHLGRVASAGVDAVVVVPSGCHRRPPPHPLVAVVGATGCLPPPSPLLSAGDAAVRHTRPARGAYRASRKVRGAAILLVDDVYTTGAHLQSAGVALLDAGARAVQPLVLGRYVGTGSPLPNRRASPTAQAP